MSAGQRLAGAGLATGAALAGVVVVLFERIMTPAGEIERYGGDIATAIDAISSNLQGLSEIEQTRQLALAVPGLAGAYLEKLGVA